MAVAASLAAVWYTRSFAAVAVAERAAQVDADRRHAGARPADPPIWVLVHWPGPLQAAELICRYAWVTAGMPLAAPPIRSAICATAGRYIYNTNYKDNTVSVSDTAANQVIDTIKTRKAPTSIDFALSGHQAYVSDKGNGSVDALDNFPQ